jgi:hypothetical protein
LADSIAFLIADGTSFALPMPKPTTPWPSPTTTSALKLRFLPPLTTLVTRLMLTTVSLRSMSFGSIFSRDIFIWLELQTCSARRIGNRANPTVIEEAAAVEHDLRDAFFLSRSAMHAAERFGAGLLPPRTLPLNVSFSDLSLDDAAATVVPARSSITCA